MKKFLPMLCCAFALCFAFLLGGCGGPAWELSASVQPDPFASGGEKGTVAPGSSFTLVVTTKNLGGDFRCDRSVKEAGATPSLYLDIGTGRVYLAMDRAETSSEPRDAVFAGGETVTVKWNFRANVLDLNNPKEMAAPAGKYALKLTFQGTEKIFEDFLEIKGE